MGESPNCEDLRGPRMAESGAEEAYAATRLAHKSGCRIRQLREHRGWSQARLAGAARMTQSAVARFEAGGTVPSLPVLERLARALDAELDVQVVPRIKRRLRGCSETG